MDLSQWADVLVIAPLSANTLAKLATGIADNLLVSLLYFLYIAYFFYLFVSFALLAYYTITLIINNLPLHHKVQKLSSATGSSGWSRKKGRKTVVCV